MLCMLTQEKNDAFHQCPRKGAGPRLVQKPNHSMWYMYEKEEIYKSYIQSVSVSTIINMNIQDHPLLLSCNRSHLIIAILGISHHL